MTGDEPHAGTAGHDADAVVLDLVQPALALGGSLAGEGRQGLMKLRGRNITALI